ncbi:hypothetical protein [Rothia endophytica]|uniref:Uncharacterized protein n=1 Tax=Rothia endophytica TaxID=1324766 RepID=A0ABP9BSE1_9MICC
MPEYLVKGLTQNARVTAELDERMEGAHDAIHGQENRSKKFSDEEMTNSAVLQQWWERWR